MVFYLLKSTHWGYVTYFGTRSFAEVKWFSWVYICLRI